MSARSRVDEARALLADLGFDAERCNERSALVLLALLAMGPDTAWASASSPTLRTVEIMDWIRHRHGHDYKPNTRETIRRQTLHQFLDAGLVAHNPDDPKRAVNSPKNCYRISEPALELCRAFGGDTYRLLLAAYMEQQPGLAALYARERRQRQIPVTLPGGAEIELTPGGQNTLIALILDEFCRRWTPAGRVLYVGDAGRDDPVFDEHGLAELGLELDKHGKLPDLVVLLEDRGWLVLIEAASSHGPVDAKRYRELHALFSGSSAGLVLVSCFPDRAEMRKYLAEIAWETEVWCADAPSHLIHFNGERFLGPYDTEI